MTGHRVEQEYSVIRQQSVVKWYFQDNTHIDRHGGGHLEPFTGGTTIAGARVPSDNGNSSFVPDFRSGDLHFINVDLVLIICRVYRKGFSWPTILTSCSSRSWKENWPSGWKQDTTRYKQETRRGRCWRFWFLRSATGLHIWISSSKLSSDATKTKSDQDATTPKQHKARN